MNTIAQVITGIILVLLLIGCRFETTEKRVIAKIATVNKSQIDTTVVATGNTIATRFSPPTGYERITIPADSFSAYLRQLPLKPAGSRVTYFDGTTKPNPNIYAAVVDLPIGKRDLHQCADAVMRLRAEYLWQQKRYDEIHFNFTNGMQVDYSEWRKGKRMKIEGNKTYWVNSNQPATDYASFWQYLELIFTYAGTASLAKELHPVSFAEMQIGDVFIQGGFPGHAVIVLDIVEESATGKRLFLLGQSYMPAQEIQVLHHPQNRALSPWYSWDRTGALVTPEWTFDKADLRRF